MIRVGIEEIHNLLQNNHPELVASYIRDNAENVYGSLHLLDEAIFLRSAYAEELARGKPFLRIYNRHQAGLLAGPAPVPALPTRAKNFTKAIFRFVVEGMPVESKAAAIRKLAICEANACGYFDGSICRHSKCGCFAKIKTFFATEQCPTGRW